MTMTDKIKEKLKEIETVENVKILLAVESGSRAWGFESPDSDYDVRFIYIRPLDEYLRLDSQKDIIEWQLDDVLDINGWDLNKSLIQFRKGNATLFEWSNSPIRYLHTPEWDTIYNVTKSYFSAKAGIYHYYGTAKNTFSSYLQDEKVKYKKYFYAIRPLLACKYIEEYNCPPPVLFDELLKLNLPDSLRNGINELLKIKKITDEKDLNPQIPVIYEFIKNELELQKELAETIADDHNKNWEMLNTVFINIVNGSK
jgi:predicted nucleotidyltransferase